jgi:hypothetical protein
VAAWRLEGNAPPGTSVTLSHGQRGNTRLEPGQQAAHAIIHGSSPVIPLRDTTVMHLLELTDIDSAHARGDVPDWALGCFRRRSISFFNGAVDQTTEVVWLQSRGLTADFRRAQSRSKLGAALTPADLSLAELLELAELEGGLARTRWDGRLMHWSDWVSFQSHAKWPEPGLLTRIGNCLIELAPSGAYVEDWRYQPSGVGPLIGLQLLEEKDVASQAIRHRGGGLIVCGEHAAFVRGRPTELPGGRLADYVRAHAHDAARLDQIFAFDAAYGTRVPTGHDFTVSLATLPWREGQPLIALDGFAYDASSGLVLQQLEENGRAIERRFSIDTLQREFNGRESTVPSPEAEAWLEREADTLLPKATRAEGQA